MNLESIIRRHFTKSLAETGQNVWSLFKWKHVDVKITNFSTGETVSEMQGLEFPEHFSQRACDIIASNYFRKNVPVLDRGCEYSYKQVVHRMVQFWTQALKDEGVISTVDESQTLYDELCYMLCAQMYAPNSPQWFNTGLEVAYGIKGEGRGHYYYDEVKKHVVESDDSYTRTQGSACFILGIQDALLGDHSITDNLTTETRLFKYGSGVGSNFSSIRSEGEKLSGGGKSSGLMSFLGVFDKSAGAIKSGGTTRRAAKMNILDADHPDVEAFVGWKAREEQKVRDLGKMGYDTEFTGEAYATVGGQNANNSVRFTDEFMRAVVSDGNWDLKSRTTGEVVKTVKASVLWKQVAECAWECGDPGVQFHNTINNWNTCTVNEFGESEQIVGSNPCSEYMFLNDTACNLASLNLMAFVRDGRFVMEDYLHCISLVHLVLEATIHAGQFPTADIARRSYLYRTTGMGYCNLGALLLNFAIPYGSDRGSDLGAYLMSAMTAQCYKVSAMLAERVGPFAVYESNKESVAGVIRSHAKYALQGGDTLECEFCPERYISDFRPVEILLGESTELPGVYAYNTLERLWEDARDLSDEHGVRNAQVTVLAPTGTISFAMDANSTSSEPFFNHLVYKKVVDGSYMRIINPISEQALRKLRLSSEEISDVKEHLMKTGSLYGAPHLRDLDYEIFKVANDYNAELTLTPMEHLGMMSKLTQQVSGAISKTVNLPSTATVEEVSQVFLDSWKMGIKAITIYRDGSKASQPLNLGGENKKAENMTYLELVNRVKELESSPLTGGRSYTSPCELIPHTEIIAENMGLKARIAELENANCEPHRHKPQGIRNSSTHELVVGDIRVYVTVAKDGLGNPIEVFINAGKQGELQRGLLETISRLVSIGLQYNIPVDEMRKIMRQQKFQPAGFVGGGHPYIKSCDSIADAVSKVLDIECGDYTYCQVKPNVDETMIHTIATFPTEKKSVVGAKIYGEKCSHCGSENLRRNGSCKVCEVCGKTTGCS